MLDRLLYDPYGGRWRVLEDNNDARNLFGWNLAELHYVQLKGDAMNIGSIFKMAKGGGFEPEMARAMLSAMGIDLNMEPVSLQDAPGELRQVAAAAGRRGASLHRLRGRMKDGSSMEAFIVLAPPSQHREMTAPPESARLIPVAS